MSEASITLFSHLAISDGPTSFGGPAHTIVYLSAGHIVRVLSFSHYRELIATKVGTPARILQNNSGTYKIQLLLNRRLGESSFQLSSSKTNHEKLDFVVT